ncbi:MAG: hypothetical protein WCD47_22885 [Candidatus Sulfotelmatobacter sp.]
MLPLPNGDNYIRNPRHPTSLLYEKHGDDYKLIGVMYTAPKRFGEDQLDQRVPLSVAQWARAREFLRRSRGTKDGISHAAPSIWFTRIHHHSGGL